MGVFIFSNSKFSSFIPKKHLFCFSKEAILEINLQRSTVCISITDRINQTIRINEICSFLYSISQLVGFLIIYVARIYLGLDIIRNQLEFLQASGLLDSAEEFSGFPTQPISHCMASAMPCQSQEGYEGTANNIEYFCRNTNEMKTYLNFSDTTNGPSQRSSDCHFNSGLRSRYLSNSARRCKKSNATLDGISACPGD